MTSHETVLNLKERMGRSTSLAKNLAAGLSRIQFTPDLLPSDITATAAFAIRTSRARLI